MLDLPLAVQKLILGEARLGWAKLIGRFQGFNVYQPFLGGTDKPAFVGNFPLLILERNGQAFFTTEVQSELVCNSLHLYQRTPQGYFVPPVCPPREPAQEELWDEEERARQEDEDLYYDLYHKSEWERMEEEREQQIIEDYMQNPDNYR